MLYLTSSNNAIDTTRSIDKRPGNATTLGPDDATMRQRILQLSAISGGGAPQLPKSKITPKNL